MQILNIFQVLVAVSLVALILVQKGQGATAGASFGAGASATVFGSRGASNFLSRTTWVLAGLFCSISLTMAVAISRTVGVPDTDLGVVADTNVATQADEVIEDLPPGATVSLSSDEESSGDLPAFEVPESAQAIEGSEVSDEFQNEEQPATDSATDPGEEGRTDSGR